MSQLRTLLRVVGLVIGAGIILFACQRVAERGRFAAPYSTFGAGPEGTHALMLLARQLGFAADAWSHELTRLPARATLVAIGGCDAPLAREVTRPEREELVRWLTAGGLLIVAGPDHYLPDALGLRLSGRPSCEAPDPLHPVASVPEGTALPLPFSLDAVPAGPPLAYAATLRMERAAQVSADDDTQATVLLESDYGPLAMTAPVGRGRVVVFGSGSPFVNGALTAGGGVVFARLLKAFGPAGPVLFDEYHLGMGERRSLVRYLRDRGFASALAQGCLIVLLALLASGQRLGPVVVEAEGAARVTQRYLLALGALYASTQDAHGALRSLARHGLSRIASHYHLQHVPLEELSRALRAHGLPAVAVYAERVTEHASAKLSAHETLLTRARAVERDVRAALVVGDA